jgi:protein O-GlcNAc transferase
MNTFNNTVSNIRNYTHQYIFKLISLRYPNLTKSELCLKLQSILKELINNIRTITNTKELDKYNTPMGFLFQHLKSDIIHIIANLSPDNDKNFLERELIYNFDWNIRLFNCMKILQSKDLIIWYFFQIPYFNNTSNTEIIKYRVLYEQMLDYFIIKWTDDLLISEKEFIYISNETCMPYAISYHNQNNSTILIKYCKLLRKICPWLNYYSPKLTEKVLKDKYNLSEYKTNEKIKICFISDSFTTDTSVLRDRISIIGKLDRNKYDVYIASFYPITSVKGIIAKVFVNKFKDKYIYLGCNNSILDNARMILDKYEFDFIVYPDLGMKLLPTLLAYSRIATTQITTWGHSETSGIDTIDYYISSNFFELPDFNIAQTHYSEKLILLKSLGTYYISPHKLFIENNPNLQSIDKIFKTKLELGFKQDDNIYCCLQTFYKINEEFEHCILNILELDPKAIILLSNSFPYCKSHLARIKLTLGDEKIKRLKWYPSLEKPIFLNLVQIADVCLDPFPFGGCNTSFDAFDYNIPVITLPSEYLHGRFTYGLYTKMEYQDCECIVNNPNDYAKIATKIGINEKLRHKINRNIEMKKHLIFQEQASITEWNNLFTNLF